MISSFKMALRSIGSNKMRAALTMLGIIIGVMALVVLVSLVNGATNTVTDEVSSLGSNYVDAYVWRQEVGSSLTINDLRKWAQENEYVEAVAPVNYRRRQGKGRLLKRQHQSLRHDAGVCRHQRSHDRIRPFPQEYGRG